MQAETVDHKTIIESVREYIANCPLMDDRKINIDYLGDGIEYSIDPIGVDPIYKKYVDGGCIRQFNFSLTSKEYYDGDARTMIENSGFYQKFADWVFEKNDQGDYPELEDYNAVKLEILMSGYLFSTDGDYARYQIQLRMLYE